MDDLLDQIVAAQCRGANANDDPVLVRSLLIGQIEAGQFVMATTAGRLDGFLAWLRTDAAGRDLLKAYRLPGLIYLALPIANRGPILVVSFCVIPRDPDPALVFRLWRAARAANPDARQVATYLTLRRGSRWIVRSLS